MFEVINGLIKALFYPVFFLAIAGAFVLIWQRGTTVKQYRAYIFITAFVVIVLRLLLMVESRRYWLSINTVAIIFSVAVICFLYRYARKTKKKISLPVLYILLFLLIIGCSWKGLRRKKTKVYLNSAGEVIAHDLLHSDKKYPVLFDSTSNEKRYKLPKNVRVVRVHKGSVAAAKTLYDLNKYLYRNGVLFDICYFSCKEERAGEYADKYVEKFRYGPQWIRLNSFENLDGSIVSIYRINDSNIGIDPMLAEARKAKIVAQIDFDEKVTYNLNANNCFAKLYSQKKSGVKETGTFTFPAKLMVIPAHGWQGDIQKCFIASKNNVVKMVSDRTITLYMEDIIPLSNVELEISIKGTKGSLFQIFSYCYDVDKNFLGAVKLKNFYAVDQWRVYTFKYLKKNGTYSSLPEKTKFIKFGIGLDKGNILIKSFKVFKD